MLKQPVTMVDPQASADTYLAIATLLPLARYRDIPAFMSLSGKVQKQIGALKGVVGYSLAADLLGKRFWTYSVWADRAALGQFMRGEPHVTAIKRMAGWVSENAALVEWQTSSPVLNWEDALEHLKQPTRYYVKPAS